MATPDLSMLVLLLIIFSFLLYSQFKKGEFSKMDYYQKYRSIIGYLVLPFLIIILLVAIFNKLFTNS
jgi:L-asparagine transporter-like permease